ncbi:MAG: hypothetical protein CML09_04455 [Puniceicoccaceae bacterium]|jgi:hypothetical protein|nr:hypothetical protein [Puniceicoccaceae bacterium]HBO57669.1 hypothetical protein [Opitutae bacterium]|tara:strand:- start:62 stop:475 length:414 start_codon:yes stop_codon:yes gene_type:complete
MKQLLILFLFLPGIVLCGIPKPHAEVSDTVRYKGVQRLIEGKDNVVAVFAKGLVCSSCGIGVRQHLKRIENVDHTRFKKGVELNAQIQVALIAVKEGAKLDEAKVSQSIYDAGYDPVHIFEWDGIKVVQRDIIQPKK